MALKKISLQKKYIYTKEERYVYPNYKFTCRKSVPFKGYRIYKINNKSVQLLKENNFSNNKDDILCYLNENIFNSIDGKGIVSGGHSVINLSDKYLCGQSAIESTELAMNIIYNLQFKYRKEFDFLIQYNDLYVEQDLTRVNKDDINKYRKQMISPLIVPVAINNILSEYSKKLNREIELNYCFSKNMADKFKRFIKKKKKTLNCFKNKNYDNGTNEWVVMLENDEIVVLKNDKPNCVSCNAAMLRDIRYNVDCNKITDNYKSYIGIFPCCSEQNVINGCKVAFELYKNFDLEVYIIIYGDSCN